MNITITMITALFAALRELVGLKSLRDQLLRRLYSVHHERVEDVALPDDIPNDHDYDMPSGSLGQENISRRLADTNHQILFLEDLVNTFVTASVTDSLVQISHQEGIGAREAIDILLESLAVDKRIARGYEYGDLSVMPSTVYRAWTT